MQKVQPMFFRLWYGTRASPVAYSIDVYRVDVTEAEKKLTRSIETKENRETGKRYEVDVRGG